MEWHGWVALIGGVMGTLFGGGALIKFFRWVVSHEVADAQRDDRLESLEKTNAEDHERIEKSVDKLGATVADGMKEISTELTNVGKEVAALQGWKNGQE